MGEKGLRCDGYVRKVGLKLGKANELEECLCFALPNCLINGRSVFAKYFPKELYVFDIITELSAKTGACTGDISGGFA